MIEKKGPNKGQEVRKLSHNQVLSLNPGHGQFVIDYLYALHILTSALISVS